MEKRIVEAKVEFVNINAFDSITMLPLMEMLAISINEGTPLTACVGNANVKLSVDDAMDMWETLASAGFTAGKKGERVNEVIKEKRYNK